PPPRAALDAAGGPRMGLPPAVRAATTMAPIGGGRPATLPHLVPLAPRPPLAPIRRARAFPAEGGVAGLSGDPSFAGARAAPCRYDRSSGPTILHLPRFRAGRPHE